MQKTLFRGSYSPNVDVTNQPEYSEFFQKKIIELFKKTDSKRVNQYIDNIKITKLEKVSMAFTLYGVTGVTKTLSEEHIPSPKMETKTDRKHSVNEYIAWDYSSTKPIEPFSNETRHVPIPESRFFSTCPTCFGDKRFPCNCNNGHRSCGVCYGTGRERCYSCNGSGNICCSACRGTGEYTESVWDGTDANGQNVYHTVYRTCNNCGGRGSLYCITCSGRGEIICRTCNGGGDVICGSCNGSRFVTCKDCKGAGAFVDQVVLHEKIKSSTWLQMYYNHEGDKDNLLNLWLEEDLKIDPRSDRCILRIEDTEPIKYIVDPLLNYGNGFDVQEDYAEVTSKMPESEKLKYIKYDFFVLERDAIDVYYTFADKEYRFRYDLSTELSLLDYDPVEELSSKYVTEIRNAHQEKRYGDFAKAIIDYEATKGENADTSIDAIEKKTEKYFTMIGLAGPAFFVLVSLVTRPYMLKSVSFYLSFAVQAAISAFVAKKLWKKVAVNKRYVTEGIFVVLGCAVSYLIKYVLHWF